MAQCANCGSKVGCGCQLTNGLCTYCNGCKLAELSYNMYNNIVLMLNKSVPAYKLTQLLTYRDILTNKQNNSDYAEHFSVEDIAGKVIRLTAGCSPRCPEVNSACIPTTITTTTINCAITSGEIICTS